MPLTKITSSGITNDAITADKISSGTITTAKIAADAITTAKIADDAVTSAKIAASAVTASDVADGTLTGAKLTTPLDLSSTVLTAPKIASGGFIADANSNEQIKFTTTASAVNEFTVTNAATGNRPDLSVTGSDTNIGLSITTKGTGLVLFNDGAYNAEATLADGATITWDVGSSPVAKVTLGGNRTLSAPTNSAAGQFIALTVIQDGTGSRTLSFNSAYEFTGDTAPTLTTTASKADIFVFKYNGTVWQETGRNLNLSIT
jgi:hypothetical protein